MIEELKSALRRLNQASDAEMAKINTIGQLLYKEWPNQISKNDAQDMMWFTYWKAMSDAAQMMLTLIEQEEKIGSMVDNSPYKC